MKSDSRAARELFELEGRRCRRPDSTSASRTAVQTPPSPARRGDKDDTYWDFLVKLVTPAVESDAPDFMTVDPQGKFSPEPSPQFVARAKAHTLSPDSAISGEIPSRQRISASHNAGNCVVFRMGSPSLIS